MRISDWSSDVCSSDLFAGADLFLEVIGKAAGKLEDRFGGGVVADQLGRAFTADFDAREQIGLRKRHAIQTLRLETTGLREALRVGAGGDAGEDVRALRRERGDTDV